jgi:hypothetical protein
MFYELNKKTQNSLNIYWNFANFEHKNEMFYPILAPKT